jgi:hypothetical protein
MRGIVSGNLLDSREGRDIDWTEVYWKFYPKDIRIAWIGVNWCVSDRDNENIVAESGPVICLPSRVISASSLLRPTAHAISAGNPIRDPQSITSI